MTSETTFTDVEIMASNVVSLSKPKITQYVAFEILTSIFERTHIMYADKSEEIKKRQWVGWENYIKIWMNDPQYMESWEKMGTTWDKKFVEYMEGVKKTIDANKSQNA